MKHKNVNSGTIRTALHKEAVLLGNGINRVKSNNGLTYSWEDLLGDLNNEFGRQVMKIDQKPFPMAYDEIIHKGIRRNGLNEPEVRAFIQSKVKSLVANPRHNDINNLNVDTFLTTNYEYLIEKAIDSKWKRQKLPRGHKDVQLFYSLFRKQQSSNKTIWHIHGEQAARRSILLGFRHYINYSSKIKKQSEDYIYKKRKGGTIRESWVNLFFTHNIKIIGLGMATTEYSLWWLIAYRDYVNNRYNDLIVDNKIEFIIPSFSNNKENHDLLEGYGVNIIKVKVKEGDYNGFYRKVLSGNY